MNEGDDTLTESCEGAVNFMVVEMRERSLHQVRLGDVVSVDCGQRRPKVGTTDAFFAFNAQRKKMDHQTWTCRAF